MSYPFAPQPQEPQTPRQAGESERVAPVVDLRTGRPVTGNAVAGRPSPRPRPPADDEAVPAGEALSGEVLPAADSPWERVRLAGERPVLPAWLTDRSVAGHRARWLMRAAVRQAARGAVRSPVVAGRVSVLAGRGTAAGVRAWWRWVRAERLMAEALDLRADASKSVWEAAYERARKARKVRAYVTLAGLPLLAAGVWVSGLVWGPLVWWGTGTVAALAAGAAGRRPGERVLTVGGEAPARPVELGMPAGQLHATIEEVMRGLRLDVTVLRSQAHPWGWDVQIMAGQSLAKVADKVDEIEPRLRTRQGAVTVITDAQDAGMGTLRLVWSDPFASMPTPPARRPGSISVRDLADIGKTLDGGGLRLPLLAHTGVVGKSGSGKSSALWTILDLLTAASDGVVFGIDLSDGPALNIWGDCITRYATTPAAAEGLLKVVIALSHARAAVMGRKLRPTADSNPNEDVDENWPVTDEEPGFFLVLDEYPLLVEAGLGELVEEFLRVARKAAGFAYIASQRAGRTEMGTTTVKAMMTNKVLLACEAQDVEMLMGPGRRSQGWRPDRLQPATPGHPNDAGRCYVSAPGHAEPRLSAVYRLDAREARRRAIERLKHIRQHGRPTIDRATWQQADAYARRRWDAGLDELLSADGALAGETAAGGVAQESGEVPAILADLRAVLVDAGVDRMHTADVLAGLEALDPHRYAGWGEFEVDDRGRRTYKAADKLAVAAKVHGVEPGQTPIRGVNRNGYRLSHIEDAIEARTGR